MLSTVMPAHRDNAIISEYFPDRSTKRLQRQDPLDPIADLRRRLAEALVRFAPWVENDIDPQSYLFFRKGIAFEFVSGKCLFHS